MSFNVYQKNEQATDSQPILLPIIESAEPVHEIIDGLNALVILDFFVIVN